MELTLGTPLPHMTSFIVWIAFVAAATGCGKTTATVSGSVTFNGEPVKSGGINLFPLDGKGAPSGALIENGRYKVVEVMPGEKTVQLTAPVLLGNQKDDNGEESKLYAELMPPEWGRASQQKMTVTGGAVTKDFSIEGPDPRKKK